MYKLQYFLCQYQQYCVYLLFVKSYNFSNIFQFLITHINHTPDLFAQHFIVRLLLSNMISSLFITWAISTICTLRLLRTTYVRKYPRNIINPTQNIEYLYIRTYFPSYMFSIMTMLTTARILILIITNAKIFYKMAVYK